MTVNQRIAILIEHLELNPNSFSKSIGLSGNSTISRIIKGQTTPSYDTLHSICTTYQFVNIRWLIIGEGDMIKLEEELSKDSIDDLIEKIEYQKGLIKTLMETLDMINQKFKDS